MNPRITPVPDPDSPSDTDVTESTSGPTGKRFAELGRAATDKAHDAYDRARGHFREISWAERIGSAIGVLVVIGGITAAVAWVLSWLGGLFASGVSTGTDTATDLALWIHDQALVRMFTDPIGDWLTTHATGLPVSVATLSLVWAASGGVLLTLATLRSRGARIGWPLYGAACAAMAWHGVDVAAHRPVVAGATVLAWSLLSVLAFRRPLLSRPRPTIVAAP